MLLHTRSPVCASYFLLLPFYSTRNEHRAHEYLPLYMCKFVLAFYSLEMNTKLLFSMMMFGLKLEIRPSFATSLEIPLRVPLPRGQPLPTRRWRREYLKMKYTRDVRNTHNEAGERAGSFILLPLCLCLGRLVKSRLDLKSPFQYTWLASSTESVCG